MELELRDSKKFAIGSPREMQYKGETQYNRRRGLSIFYTIDEYLNAMVGIYNQLFSNPDDPQQNDLVGNWYRGYSVEENASVRDIRFIDNESNISITEIIESKNIGDIIIQKHQLHIVYYSDAGCVLFNKGTIIPDSRTTLVFGNLDCNYPLSDEKHKKQGDRIDIGIPKKIWTGAPGFILTYNNETETSRYIDYLIECGFSDTDHGDHVCEVCCTHKPDYFFEFAEKISEQS